MGRRLDVANADKRAKAIDDLSGLNRKFTDGLLQAGDHFVSKKSTV